MPNPPFTTPPILKREANFAEPERIIRSFDLERGDFIADFGAGHGFFTIPMARIVGGDGKVFAIDIQKDTLDVVRARAKLDHLLNIEYIWADLDEEGGSRLKNEFIDFVLVSNVLFQAENKAAYIKEARRILRTGGRLAIIEWDETPTPLGPPIGFRVKKESAIELAQSAGFSLEKEFEAGSHHYGLLFVKKQSAAFRDERKALSE